MMARPGANEDFRSRRLPHAVRARGHSGEGRGSLGNRELVIGEGRWSSASDASYAPPQSEACRRRSAIAGGCLRKS